MVNQALPYLGKLLLAHLSVGNHDGGIRQKLLDGRSTAVNSIHTVMQIKYLSAAPEFLVHRLGQNSPVMLHDIGLNRLTVLRGFLNGGHIAYTRHRHIEGSRNRGRRKGQHIDIVAHLLKAFLVLDSKALFLVDNTKSQILKLDILLYQSMGSDHNIDLSTAQFFQNLLLFPWGSEAGKDIDLDRETFHSLAEGLIVLPCQDGGRHQNRALLSIHDTFKRCTNCNFGLAKSYVAAEQSVHRNRLFHVILDFLNTTQLVIGLVIRKTSFKVILPVGILTEGVSFCRFSFGIEFDKLIRHILNRFFNSCTGLCPFCGI